MPAYGNSAPVQGLMAAQQAQPVQPVPPVPPATSPGVLASILKALQGIGMENQPPPPTQITGVRG